MAESEQTPWLRLPNETETAYAAFCRFRDMGSGRTLVDAYRGCHAGAKRVAGRWQEWSKKYTWQQRAIAYDNRIGEAEQRGIDRVAESDGAKLARRRQQWVELEYAAAVALVTAELAKIKKGDSRGSGQNLEAAARLARQSLRMPMEVEKDAPVDLSKSLFITDGQLDAAMPAGVVPPMPEDPSLLPPMKKSIAGGSATLAKPTSIPRP